ncbi:MAG: transposase family protein [Chlamydiia bacterium]
MPRPKGTMPTHVKPKTFEHPYPDHPLLAIFSLIEDPRRPSPGFRYPFLSVLFIALVSVICGAKDWAQVDVIYMTGFESVGGGHSLVSCNSIG